MRLFVRNLAWAVTDADLATFFESQGYEVADAQVVVSGENGRSRGRRPEGLRPEGLRPEGPRSEGPRPGSSRVETSRREDPPEEFSW